MLTKSSKFVIVFGMIIDLLKITKYNKRLPEQLC